MFAHFSVIDMSGYRELQPGEQVSFTYTTPGQDGCDHSAQYVKRLDANAANTVATEELSIVSRRAAPQPPPADDIELF